MSAWLLGALPLGPQTSWAQAGSPLRPSEWSAWGCPHLPKVPQASTSCRDPLLRSFGVLSLAPEDQTLETVQYAWACGSWPALAGVPRPLPDDWPALAGVPRPRRRGLEKQLFQHPLLGHRPQGSSASCKDLCAVDTLSPAPPKWSTTPPLCVQLVCSVWSVQMSCPSPVFHSDPVDPQG